jgi:hypothetical protein
LWIGKKKKTKEHYIKILKVLIPHGQMEWVEKNFQKWTNKSSKNSPLSNGVDSGKLSRLKKQNVVKKPKWPNGAICGTNLCLLCNASNITKQKLYCSMDIRFKKFKHILKKFHYICDV